MQNQHPLDIQIQKLLDDENWAAIPELFATAHPADIARAISQAGRKHRPRLFALVPEPSQPDVLAEMDDEAADLLKSHPNAEISDFIEEMEPDDAADLLADLPGEQAAAVLNLMEPEESRDVRRLLTYPEDSAGGIMTTDFVAMHKDTHLPDAFEKLKNTTLDVPFYVINLVDEQMRLVGYIELWELFKESGKAHTLSQIMHTDVISVSVDTDQEEVARRLRHYNLTVIPVVDAQGHLVGRITPDDVMDVMEEEASEDILRMGGSDDSELETPSVLKSCSARMPWLCITLVGGFVTSLLFKWFTQRIGDGIALTFFIPVVMAMGGNTGIQSSTLMVRSIALGDTSRSQIKRLLWREIGIGSLMGAFCGGLIGIWAMLLMHFSGDMQSPLLPLQLAAVVALALFCAMTFAAVFGALVPTLLDKIKVDPAIASGPFITVTNDIAALSLYFMVTVLLLVYMGF